MLRWGLVVSWGPDGWTAASPHRWPPSGPGFIAGVWTQWDSLPGVSASRQETRVELAGGNSTYGRCVYLSVSFGTSQDTGLFACGDFTLLIYFFQHGA